MLSQTKNVTNALMCPKVFKNKQYYSRPRKWVKGEGTYSHERMGANFKPLTIEGVHNRGRGTFSRIYSTFLQFLDPKSTSNCNIDNNDALHSDRDSLR